MTTKSMENVYLVCPLSLGDYFVCNALVRYYLALSHQVVLPAVPQFMETIRCLYSDWPNIEIVPYLGQQIESELIQERKLKVVNFRTVFEINHLPLQDSAELIAIPVNWDRQIYEHFDWCYSRRYQDFRLPKNIPNSVSLYQRLNPKDEPYVLFHRHTSKHVGGINIDLAAWRPSAGLDPSLKIIEVEIGHSPNLLDYVELIRKAKEIHVVPSSLHCLVDSMVNQTSAELFFHDARLDTMLQPNCRWNSNRWHIVRYGAKQ